MGVWEFVQSNSEALTALFTIVGSTAVVFATILALPQLIVVRRNAQLESTLTFLKLMKEGSEDREFVYKELPVDIQALQQLSDQNRRRVEKVIVSLNDVGLLFEEVTIPKRLFFGVYHTMIIRLWYKLQHYAKYHETRIGGRYARRLERLDRRAKLYHDINPKHRETVIRLDTGKGEPVKVYETHKEQGLKGFVQEVIWFFRRCFGIY